MSGRLLPLALVLGMVAACGGAGPEPVPEAPATPPERIASFLGERSGPELRTAPRLGAGDVVRIDAVGVEEATGDYVVPRRGSIRVPFVGDVRVEGRTVDEVVDELARRLRVVVDEPLVDVRLIERGSAEAWIEGAVATPGRVPIGLRGRTLGEALALAGGLRDDASGFVRLVPAADAPPGLFAEPVADEERRIELSVVEDAAVLGLHLRPGDRVLALAAEGAPLEPGTEPLPRLVLADEVPLVAATPARPELANVREPSSTLELDEPIGAEAPAADADVDDEIDEGATGIDDEVEDPLPAPEATELAPPATDPPDALEADPAGEADLFAGVEDQLDVAERALEEQVALENEIRDSRVRVRELEDAVRAERAEAESLRARLAELEARLDARDAAIRGAYGDAPPPATVTAPPPETAAEASIEPFEPGAAEAAMDELAGIEGDDENVPDAEGLDERADEPAEPRSGGGMFARLFGVFGGDDDAETDAGVETAALPEAAPEARVEIVGSVAKPGPYGLGTARTVSGAIELAGATDDADLGAIEVRRPWGQTVWTIVVDLADVREGRASDLLLVDGDVIVVPAAE